jgi:beta-lactamase class D
MRRRMTVTVSLTLVLMLLALGCAGAGGAGGVAAPAAARTESQGGAAAQPDLGAYFKNTAGTFVLYDLRRGRYLRHNPARAAERFSPYSTFKIPNSLIGLETGVIKDADYEIKWDAKKYPPHGDTLPFTSWWQDQTLRTAFQRSAVWYYQELAKRVGARTMREFVSKLQYGNEDTSGGVDRFWLNSTLKISADEQVEFLRKLHAGALPLSARSMGIVKEIMLLEQTPTYTLRAKTGGGPLGARSLGWFVGYVETTDNVYFFATQIEGENYLAIRDERTRLTRAILTDLGYMRESKK